jgi:hypothetical protein
VRQLVRARHDGEQRRVQDVAGVLVVADDPLETCPVCHRSLVVQKTVLRHGLTLSHGAFRVRETVRVCGAGCRHAGARVIHRPATLARLLPPGSVAGYDVLVHIGLARFVQHRQRDEIRAALEHDHGLVLSSGAISDLGRRFLVYLDALHHAQAPAIRAAMDADGGWPLHLDATGEAGRGTLLVVFSGWRRWVLGAWKVPSERSDVLLPRLIDTAARFGAPCGLMRDLGRAVTDAAAQFVRTLAAPIPVFACHQHFLADVGTDLLQAGHDTLRGLFRGLNLRQDLRAFVRTLGRTLGPRLHAARVDLQTWLAQPVLDKALPDGATGIAVVRALAQWILDAAADGTQEGFPYDLPYRDLYVRCLHVRRAVEGLLRQKPADAQVATRLVRLQKMLAPMACDVPPLARVAHDLEQRATLFADLRTALRLPPAATAPTEAAVPTDAPSTVQACDEIRAAVAALTARLHARRTERRLTTDLRQAIDIILTHLDRHGPFLWGHAITVHAATGGVRLVDRTNNILESFFHGMKHGERRRSGRKILTQDFERLPAAAALALNLTHPDYVALLCGSLEQLPRAFARLDEAHRSQSLPARTDPLLADETETASMTSADKRLIRFAHMEERIMAAGR